MMTLRAGVLATAFAAIAASLASGCGSGQVGAIQPASAPFVALDSRKPGVGLEYFAKVGPELFRGGIPAAADLVTLKKKYGIKTDINLIGFGKADQKALVEEERQAAAKAGIKYVNIPLPFTAPPQAMIDKFIATVQDPANQPVYVHCKHGRDRTGTMVALYRITVDGISGQEALAQMQEFGYEPDRFPYYTKAVLNYRPAR
jgi:protein tyrosine/serine phosphatase